MKYKLMTVTVLLALTILSAACGAQSATVEPGQATGPAVEGATTSAAGATAGVPQTGSEHSGVPANLEEALDLLRIHGATVNLADPVQSDVLSAPGQIVHINNEEVEFYTYQAAEAVAAEAPLVADLTTPEGQPQFYRLGNMLVRYVGSDSGLRDLLEDVLGAQAAKQ
jgi:hypothetical protein